MDGRERPLGRDVGPFGCGRVAPVVQPWLEGPEEAGAWDGIWAVELGTGPLTQGDLSLDQMALRGEWQEERWRSNRSTPKEWGQGRGDREGQWPGCPIRRGADGW